MFGIAMTLNAACCRRDLVYPDVQTAIVLGGLDRPGYKFPNLSSCNDKFLVDGRAAGGEE